MGSMLHFLGVNIEESFDNLNLTHPDLVESVHRQYVAAGAELIETNTFSANRNQLGRAGLVESAREINLAGARLARQCASSNVYVAGSVGPLGKSLEADSQLRASEQAEAFREQIEALVEGNVDLILLETFSDLDEISIAFRAARELCDLPVICQMAFTNELHTLAGVSALDALRTLEMLGADVVGGNCGAGPNALVKVMENIAGETDLPLSAFPNASYPQYADGRYFFVGDPEYLADGAARLAETGANLIGGCCGTTPAHIRAMAQRLAYRFVRPRRKLVSVAVAEQETVAPAEPQLPDFLQKVGREPVVIVELDPPRGLVWQPLVEGAKTLAQAGTDAISVAENSLASIRMSSMVMGHFIQRDAGIPAIVHITCRDRNLLGQQSELMGASELGIRYVLAITGDPVSMGGVLGATSVYDTNSFGLIEMLTQLNRGESVTGRSLGRRADFIVAGGFNPNVRKLEGEVKRLSKKVERGATFALTQPVYDAAKVPEIYDQTSHLGIPIFLGVLPLYSARNCEFLHNEVPGIRIPDGVRKRMVEASEGDAWKVGIEICAQFIGDVLNMVPGVYIVPPFGRHEMALPLVKLVKSGVPTGAVKGSPLR